MKSKNKVFKILASTLTFGLLILANSSCGSKEQSNKDSEEVAQEQNAENFTAVSTEDADFLVNAAVINLKEIQLGQLTKSNSELSDVKTLGDMMETEHTKTQEELKPLAEKKHVTLPASLVGNAQDDYQKLLNLSGRDFDVAYTDLMVKGHQDAIELFTKVSTGTGDVEIRNWATNVLLNLKIHLDHAVICQEKVQLVQKSKKSK